MHINLQYQTATGMILALVLPNHALMTRNRKRKTCSLQSQLVQQKGSENNVVLQVLHGFTVDVVFFPGQCLRHRHIEEMTPFLALATPFPACVLGGVRICALPTAKSKQHFRRFGPKSPKNGPNPYKTLRWKNMLHTHGPWQIERRQPC